MIMRGQAVRGAFGAFWLVAVLAAAAGQASGAQPAHEGKAKAPGMEQNADYFSDNRRDVSPEDLKKADKLRRKTMASIEDLLQSKKSSIRRFELLLRLGELHVERHDYLRDGEMGAYDKAWEAWSKDKKGVEPKLATTGSDEEMTKAANAFRRLVTEFPKHPRTDAALYSLARVLARMGKDSSVDYYKELIKAFPKSPLIPDTYLSLGEFYFEKHDIASAITNYKRVMDFKDHRAFPYAVYKLGWAYYDSTGKNEKDTLDNYKKAVAAFKLVVKLADRDREAGKVKSNLDLRDEAIKDLVMVWAETEDVASAWKYFKSIGEQGAFYTMLERLGGIYADQGKNQQAIAVYQRLLKDAPRRPGNPDIHSRLVELYDLTNNTPAVVAELKNMHALYLGKTAWAQANKDDAASLGEANRIAELQTHRFGAMFHERGQKTKNDQYLRWAADVYALYLQSFPQSPNAYDIRYYLAEILFDFKQYEAASGHYLLVAKADPKGKYLKPAALNAVAAMNQLVQQSKGPTLPPAGQVPSPLEIPHAKHKLVETIDQYVVLLPKEKDGEPMRFTAAQTLFEYGHYPEAIARFERITREIPESKQAKVAVRVILGYSADKEDWTKVISWAQAFVKLDRLMDKDLRKYVVDLQRSAMFKQALAYEKAQKYDRAAHSFLEFQKEFPQDANADRSMFNAMLNYYKVEKIEPALATAKSLLDKYPRSALVPDVLANVGSTHESLAKFDEAAGAYKRLALGYPRDKRAPNALYNAAVLYKGLKNDAEAINLLAEFGKRYGDQPAAPDAAMELAGLLERNHRNDEAVRAYQAYAARYASHDQDLALEATAKAASLRLATADRAAGQRDLERLRQLLSAKGAPAAYEARATVATALFKQAEPTFGDFQAAPINDGARIEAQVTAKQRKLEKLAAAYEQIIDLGSAEYTVAALYRLGEAHENFATALFKAPAPKGASQGEIDKLKTELEKVAFPLKDEAYKFFETAYKRSREVETFTTWTRRTYQKMVELAPDKHPEVNELSAEPTYLSHEVKLSRPVAELVGGE